MPPLFVVYHPDYASSACRSCYDLVLSKSDHDARTNPWRKRLDQLDGVKLCTWHSHDPVNVLDMYGSEQALREAMQTRTVRRLIESGA